MYKAFIVVGLTSVLLCGPGYETWAQSANDATAAQELGSRTRRMIATISRHGTDMDSALHYQTEGDQALRSRDLVRAAEEYGRAEELIAVLEARRTRALQARLEMQKQIGRARRTGGDVAQAEILNEKGDQAIENGDFTDAELYYGEARTALVAGR
jgi:hypothetical protein